MLKLQDLLTKTYMYIINKQRLHLAVIHSVAAILMATDSITTKLVLTFFKNDFQEDDKVVELVRKYGPKRWSLIAQHLKGRIGKQCRERQISMLFNFTNEIFILIVADQGRVLCQADNNYTFSLCGTIQVKLLYFCASMLSFSERKQF